MRIITLYFILLLIFSCEPGASPDQPLVNYAPIPVKAENAIDRFEPEIIEYEKDDLVRPLLKGDILFTGSSSIRLWKSLKIDLTGFPVHNRGFGGSTLPELIHYSDRIIFKYRPKLIVLYCGENDIADGATPKEVLKSVKTFVKLMEERLPETKLVYLAMKPSLARWNFWPEYQRGNQLIEAYTKTKQHLDYIAVDQPMLQEDGNVNSAIFVDDMLHMNEKGYALWSTLLNDYLGK